MGGEKNEENLVQRTLIPHLVISMDFCRMGKNHLDTLLLAIVGKKDGRTVKDNLETE